jgi:hypothetical protein
LAEVKLALEGEVGDLQAYQAAVLREIGDRLLSLTELTKQTIPEGVAETIEMTITGASKQQIRPVSPWFSFSFYNKVDSDKVYVTVNKSGADPHPIEEDETYNCNMGAAKIQCIYVWCDSGGTANIKLSAVR